MVNQLMMYVGRVSISVRDTDLSFFSRKIAFPRPSMSGCLSLIFKSHFDNLSEGRGELYMSKS